jgi:hypothetical protein
MSTNLRLVSRLNDKPVLTCWKDIALYVGKSVRTLQRWERELGLPVRRTKPGEKRSVLAIPGEIDFWVRSQQVTDGSDRAALLRALVVLQKENRELRRQLADSLAKMGRDVLLQALVLLAVTSREFRSRSAQASDIPLLVRCRFFDAVPSRLQRRQTWPPRMLSPVELSPRRPCGIEAQGLAAHSGQVSVWLTKRSLAAFLASKASCLSTTRSCSGCHAGVPTGALGTGNSYSPQIRRAVSY